jgi:hypothetical protein
MPDPSLKERLNRRLEGLKSTRQSYETDAKEIASLAMPSRSRFLASGANKGRQTNRKLNNGHGIRAFRTLQGGMTSGLSSESRPWFNLQTLDESVNEDPEVRAYLSEVERRLYAFLAKTNFYGAVKTGYLELGGFGTEACIMFEHPTEGAVCHQLTFGEYWLALGSALTPEALYRECAMTALQAVQRFQSPMSPSAFRVSTTAAPTKRSSSITRRSRRTTSSTPTAGFQGQAVALGLLGLCRRHQGSADPAEGL